MTSSNPASLKGSYGSPSDSKAFTHTLPVCSTAPSTEHRTSYLAALRSAVSQLQSEVNEFLTDKMEHDKAMGVATSPGMSKEAREDKEADNYGEEILDDN